MRNRFQYGIAAQCWAVVATALLFGACTGNIIAPTPTPQTPSVPVSNTDVACPSMIADQPTNLCPRLKNMSLSCGGNGMLHTSVGGGSGQPIILGATLDNGSVFSGVLVIVNCQDGPREGVTFGVKYTGQVSIPTNGPPCIAQSKADYTQFQFGNPGYAGFEGMAKGQLHQTFDNQSISAFATRVGLPTPAASRCSFWRQMP